MPVFRTAQVSDVLEEHADHQILRIRIGVDERRAVLYRRYCASAGAGDRVVVNTTADELGLGSAGQDFVVWNLEHATHEAPSGGHIMKLRYTPAQSDVVAVEAPESEHHAAMAEADSLDGMPVVAMSLHSQLVPVVAGIRTVRPDARVAYVMTDGGALEAGFSRTLRRLREVGWVCGSITAGHAIGGDLEAVTVYSALLASRVVLEADVTVVGMGPGVVGSATPFGTTGIELGTSLNAVAALGGHGVAALRASLTDPRERHRGLSHHADVALRTVALGQVDMPVPTGTVAGLGGDRPGTGKWRIFEVDPEPLLEAFEEARDQGLELSHMGRSLEDDRLFFQAAGVAGIHAATLVE